ncbi:MAG: YtoQ family protein [Nitrospinota bacterium]|nr:YtoQ family protein [Nitrospinota bacterium]
MNQITGGKVWRVYLSGEIHTDWRECIEKGVLENNLPVELFSPITNHDASDNCGVDILGGEEKTFWKDHKAAKINSIRIRNLIKESDVVVVRFGEKYKQWNAAFDAGVASALGKSIITIHAEEHTHALKEIDGVSLAVAQTPEQVVEILKHISRGK